MRLRKNFQILVFTLSLSPFLSAAVDATPCAAFLRAAAYENLDISRFGAGAPNSQVQEMANLFLSFAPRVSDRQVQVAFPVFLFFNERQPQQFGDGQSNANATFGELRKPPFVAVLTRGQKPADSAELVLILSQEISGLDQVRDLEVMIAGERKIIAIDANRNSQMSIDPEKLGWNQLYNPQPVFFRPVGWNDWFSVQFPQAYVPIDELLRGLPTAIDPLQINGAMNPLLALQQIPDSKSLGFQYAYPRPRVHGIYTPENGPELLTATGGIVTRYLMPSATNPFKRVYLAKDPRNMDIERAEGVVSGTGPHHIGATGETILNSLGAEPIMTLYGSAAPNSGPEGARLAWGFTHQFLGTWLRPGEAFVTPRGNYHWHLNHLNKPVAAEVFTPQEVPNPQNHYGHRPH